MATIAEQLTSVQSAIAAIESGGQSITISGRTYQRADLAELYRREQYLQDKVERASTQSRTLAQF